MTHSDIRLPDLDDVHDAEIVAGNIRAVGPVIVAAMFEELKLFDVADRIVELFQRGALPIGSGRAGRKLDRYWREASGRMTEHERRSFYAITLGLAEGDPAAAIDRAFDGLWLRFVAAVAGSAQRRSVTRRARIVEAARALSAQLSRRGTGIHAAASALQGELGTLADLLQDPDVLRAYGVRDMWQLVDQVAADQLGGAQNSARFRTLATSSAIIIDWLADRSHRIERDSGPALDLRKPADRKLVEACSSWLHAMPRAAADAP